MPLNFKAWFEGGCWTTWFGALTSGVTKRRPIGAYDFSARLKEFMFRHPFVRNASLRNAILHFPRWRLPNLVRTRLHTVCLIRSRALPALSPQCWLGSGHLRLVVPASCCASKTVGGRYPRTAHKHKIVRPHSTYFDAKPIQSRHSFDTNTTT